MNEMEIDVERRYTIVTGLCLTHPRTMTLRHVFTYPVKGSALGSDSHRRRRRSRAIKSGHIFF